MIGYDDILKTAKEASSSLEENKNIAYKAINEMPEGQTKEAFKNLLSQASTGKISIEQALTGLKNILKDAS